MRCVRLLSRIDTYIIVMHIIYSFGDCCLMQTTYALAPSDTASLYTNIRTLVLVRSSTSSVLTCQRNTVG